MATELDEQVAAFRHRRLDEAATSPPSSPPMR
ncbi:hypothetical protein [Gordonia sp. (in: high G+C Gram-positive bacteria)]